MRYWPTVIMMIVVMACCTSSYAQTDDGRTRGSGSWSTVTHTPGFARAYRQSRFHIPSKQQALKSRRRFWSGAGIPIDDHQENSVGWIDRMREQFKNLF